MALEVNVNIDPETINQYVAQAILDSALGTNLKAAIGEEVGRLAQRNSYNGPNTLEKVVQAEVARIVRDLIASEPYASQIQAAVKEWATEATVRRIAHAAWDDFMNKVDKAGYGHG